MTPEELFKVLQPVQEKRGYFFNLDRALTLELLAGLLANKQHYGYMLCPCRLASGERERDKDIICPCVYREPDVTEYGSCFCGLYVSKEWNDGKIDRRYVPERRSPELYGL